MSVHRAMLIGVIGFLAAGCASGPPFIDQIQPEAVNMAVRRAKFEMNCQNVTSEVVSRETLQPLVQTVVYTGVSRAEYTVGVSGCGQRALYVVICPDNGSMTCYAGAARNSVR